MTARLTAKQTRQAIRALGILRPLSATFGISDPSRGVRYEFHRHTRHQLIFPKSGVLFIETDHALHVCSPQLGLWIPAGLKHATTTGTDATISLYFGTSKFPAVREPATAVRIDSVLRELAIRAIGRPDPPAFHEALFQVIHGLVNERLTHAARPVLPVPKSAELHRTITIAIQNLPTIDVPDLARKSGQSERTLRRRFSQELGMGPEMFIQRTRLMHAMQTLIDLPTRAIIDVALDVGYANHSAFTSAFRAYCGQTPTAFRRAAMSAQPSPPPGP